MRSIFYATAAMFITMSLTHAQSGMMGFGMRTCGQFAKDYQSSPDLENVYFTWAQGYLSGANVVFVQTTHHAYDLSSISVEDQKRFLRDYCDKHSLADYHKAVDGLWEKFKFLPP